MALDMAYPLQPKAWNTSLTVTNTTLAKILVDETPAQILAAISGELPFPGETSVRQRALTGGCRVIDGIISSTDAAAKSLLMFLGRKLSTLGAGTHTITTQNVLTRVDGVSFITEGWRAGDNVMLFDSNTAANNGVLAVVTAVAANTLTVTGTPWTNDAAVGTARVFRVTQRTRKAVAANAGNTDAIAPVALLTSRAGDAQDPAIALPPDAGLSLGPADILAVALVANASALPASINVSAHTLLY